MTSSAPDGIWSFRFDGTIQCADAPEISLETMRADLENERAPER